VEALNTWIEVPQNSDFTIYNLPVGIFSTKIRPNPRVGIAIGEEILDLARVAEIGLMQELEANKAALYNPFLNDYISLGKSFTTKVRKSAQQWLTDENTKLKDYQNIFVHQSKATMHMPVRVGDYTDFYSSIEHATNVGKMFRDPDNALLPNWRHIPVGYHGRSSSIVESGVPIRRPNGQTKPDDGPPVYGPSKRLDFELEMAFIVGKDTQLGEVVTTQQAEEHIFGMVLFNDWSARDIQKWEYIPLGPFLGKNFGSSISPWVVPLEALEPFRVTGPQQEPEVLPYLKYQGQKNYDINLEVTIQPEDSEATTVSRSNFKYMYWNMAQQLAHHTINGCNIKVGDMMASGTISGKDESSYGSMLELSWAGSKPLNLSDGSKRAFIEDNDTVTMRGFAEKEGIRIGFGEVRTKILPAV